MTPNPYLPHRKCQSTEFHSSHEWQPDDGEDAMYCGGVAIPGNKECANAYHGIPHVPHTWQSKENMIPFHCPGKGAYRRDHLTTTEHMTSQMMAQTPWTDSLIQMMDRQRKLQEKSYGFNFDTMTEEERVLFAKDQILALLDEAHEALAEIGWKPWATSRHLNREAFIGELVDVWHFLMNLLLVAQCPPHDFFTRYVAKNEKNARRQAEEYDGVSTKCPGCKRAYDDDAVKCTPAQVPVDEPETGAFHIAVPYCEKNGFLS